MLPTQPEVPLCAGVGTLVLKQGVEMHSWARTERWPPWFRGLLLERGAAWRADPAVLSAGTGSQQTKLAEQQSLFYS